MSREGVQHCVCGNRALPGSPRCALHVSVDELRVMNREDRAARIRAQAIGRIADDPAFSWRVRRHAATIVDALLPILRPGAEG